MSFAIPSLTSFLIKINTGGGGTVSVSPPTGLGSLGNTCGFLTGGVVGTSTTNASLVFTTDGSNPTSGVAGSYFVNCQNIYLVPPWQNLNTCSGTVGPTAIGAGTLTVKVAAYLSGVYSTVSSGTVAGYTCPGGVTDPTITVSCPNGQGGFGCNNGVVTFTFQSNSCGVTYYRTGFGSSPQNSSSGTYDGVISGLGTASVTLNGTSSPFGQVWASCITYNPACSLTGNQVTTTYGYQYP